MREGGFQRSAALLGESAVHTQAGHVAQSLHASLAFLGKKEEEEEQWAKIEDTSFKELIIFHWQKSSTLLQRKMKAIAPSEKKNEET